MNKDKEEQQIRNSTIDFLIFTRQNGENGITIRIADENVWLRAEAIAELFQKSRTTIVEHLKKIFASGELDENSVCRNFRQTAEDGKSYNVYISMTNSSSNYLFIYLFKKYKAIKSRIM